MENENEKKILKTNWRILMAEIHTVKVFPSFPREELTHAI